jgi:hypothetical protein
MLLRCMTPTILPLSHTPVTFKDKPVPSSPLRLTYVLLTTVIPLQCLILYLLPSPPTALPATTSPPLPAPPRIGDGSHAPFDTLLSSTQNVVAAVQHAIAGDYALTHPPDSFAPLSAPSPALPSSTTIVTSYYTVPSKHSSDEYVNWISNLMSFDNNFVIFTEAQHLDLIRSLRVGKEDRTVIVIEELGSSSMATKYDSEFWERQQAMDPEGAIHKSKELYIIWNEKVEWLKRASVSNPFDSDFFAWFDIGFFRSDEFVGVDILKNLDNIELQRGQVMLLDCSPLMWYVPEFAQTHSLGGGFVGGDAEGIYQYHKVFYEALDTIARTGFIGKDQPVMYSACEIAPQHVNAHGTAVDLCQIVRSVAGYGDRWFFMAKLVHGDIKGRTPLYGINDPWTKVEELHDRWARGAVQLPAWVETYWRDENDKIQFDPKEEEKVVVVTEAEQR